MSDETPETTNRLQELAGNIWTKTLPEATGRINKRALRRGVATALILAGLFTAIKKFKTKEA